MSAFNEAKYPVTMRLPRREFEIVQEYAKATDSTRTEALLHFLKLGIASSGGVSRTTDNVECIERIEHMLEEVLHRLPEKSSIDSNFVNRVIKEEAARFPAIKSAILFGSFARGEATQDSDIDIRLVVDRKDKFSLYDLVRFQKALQQKTGREIDVITADVLENENLTLAIEQEGITVYERKTK